MRKETGNILSRTFLRRFLEGSSFEEAHSGKGPLTNVARFLEEGSYKPDHFEEVFLSEAHSKRPPSREPSYNLRLGPKGGRSNRAETAEAMLCCQGALDPPIHPSPRASDPQ